MTTRLIYIIENFNRNSFCVGPGPRAGRHRFGLAVFHLELLHGRLASWETQTWSWSEAPLLQLYHCNVRKTVRNRVCNQIRFKAIQHDEVTLLNDCESPASDPWCGPSSWHQTDSGPPPHPWSPPAGLTDWLMARPAHKSTFSQNCKPNLPNVKFVHRSLLFALKSYFNTFPNYTWVTKNLH